MCTVHKSKYACLFLFRGDEQGYGIDCQLMKQEVVNVRPDVNQHCTTEKNQRECHSKGLIRGARNA